MEETSERIQLDVGDLCPNCECGNLQLDGDALVCNKCNWTLPAEQ